MLFTSPDLSVVLMFSVVLVILKYNFLCITGHLVIEEWIFSPRRNLKEVNEVEGVFEATSDSRHSLFSRPLPVHQTDGLLEHSLFPWQLLWIQLAENHRTHRQPNKIHSHKWLLLELKMGIWYKRKHVWLTVKQ